MSQTAPGTRPLTTRLLAGLSAGVVALGLAATAAPADAAPAQGARKTSWTAAHDRAEEAGG